MATAATSALRLHQRLPQVQFNRQFLGKQNHHSRTPLGLVLFPRTVPVRGRGSLLDILCAVSVRGSHHAGPRPGVPLRPPPLCLVHPHPPGHPGPEFLVGSPHAHQPRGATVQEHSQTRSIPGGVPTSLHSHDDLCREDKSSHTISVLQIPLSQVKT